MAIALDFDTADGPIDRRKFRIGQIDLNSADVFFEPVQLSCARDGGDPWLLRQHPGEGQLRGRDLPSEAMRVTVSAIA